jgi:hypothetical protein
MAVLRSGESRPGVSRRFSCRSDVHTRLLHPHLHRKSLSFNPYVVDCACVLSPPVTHWGLPSFDKGNHPFNVLTVITRYNCIISPFARGPPSQPAGVKKISIRSIPGLKEASQRALVHRKASDYPRLDHVVVGITTGEENI